MSTMLLAAALTVSYQAVTITRVEIVVRDVFEDAGGKPGNFPYTFANRLHIETRESVVRRELLFAVGDPVDAEALAQTERNLRALPFFRDVAITTYAVEDGEGVAVRVVTSDSWTTVPEVRLAKVGDEWVWALGASERNLFGYGKQLALLRDSDLDREETSLYYADPRFAGSRFRLSALVSDASDGHDVSLVTERPFFSLDTLWGFRVGGENYDRLDPLYEDGERVAELRHQRRFAEVAIARAVRRTDTGALRLHLAYQRSVDDVGAERRDFGVVRLGVTSVRHGFVQHRYLNHFERIEDVNLGNQASAFVGVSSAPLGGEPGNAYFFFLSDRKGFPLGGSGFVSGVVSWQARRRDEELQNELSRLRLDVVHKPSTRSALLAKADFQYGRNLDPEVQLRLGAESGLKGYPVRQFAGNRSFLAGLEARWFVADDVARLVSFGLAAFVESGYAWPEGMPMALSDLRSDVGVSLLLGATRASSSRPGVRIDVAYALAPLAGRSPWLVSAGSQIGF